MAAAFSPDRRWLATAEERGIVRLWDLTALATPKVLVSGQHAKWVAFSPNSRWLIVTDGSDDFESPNYETFFSTVWDLSNPAEPKRAMVTRSFGKGLDNPLFSPDSRWLLTNCNEHCAAEDLGPSTITAQTLMLWDLNAPAARPKIFRVDGLQAAFSPNGRWLLVGATLWDLTAPDFTASAIELPLVSREKSWVIEAVAFTHDSRRAIVCTDDVLVYDLDTADLLRTAARAAVRNLTAAEFRELLPAERYRKAFVHLP
jgi:WD40 repeat protein